jgi:hypothetical protein
MWRSTGPKWLWIAQGIRTTAHTLQIFRILRAVSFHLRCRLVIFPDLE